MENQNDNTTVNFKNKLEFEMPLGFKVNGQHERNIELLKTNGVAEEVFLKKNSEKPYTWIGNVISIATGRIGEHSVGTKAREGYTKNGTIEIPQLVKLFPLAEANSMLVEIHRRVWQNIIPKQQIMCKFCAKTLIADIDLNRIALKEEDIEKLKNPESIEFIVVDLEDGFELNDWVKEIKKQEIYPDLMDRTFNRLIFRIPTLGDAIKNEKWSTSDNIKFWRVMAFDCLVGIQAIDKETNEKLTDVPSETFVWLGLKLFEKYLSQNDLRAVRKGMREEIPTLPFDYRETCPCDRQKEIPYAMEATSFFSE